MCQEDPKEIKRAKTRPRLTLLDGNIDGCLHSESQEDEFESNRAAREYLNDVECI